MVVPATEKMIAEEPLLRSMFATIQQNAIRDGKYPHIDNYQSWCLTGNEVERAIRDIFAEDGPFRVTKDITH